MKIEHGNKLQALAVVAMVLFALLGLHAAARADNFDDNRRQMELQNLEYQQQQRSYDRQLRDIQQQSQQIEVNRQLMNDLMNNEADIQQNYNFYASTPDVPVVPIPNSPDNPQHKRISFANARGGDTLTLAFSGRVTAAVNCKVMDGATQVTIADAFAAWINADSTLGREYVKAADITGVLDITYPPSVRDVTVSLSGASGSSSKPVNDQAPL